MELDKNGYRVATYEEILNEINNDIKSQIPELSLEDSNPLIKINKKMADLFHRMSLAGASVYKSYSIDEASGGALEDRVAWLGITRLKSTKSSGSVEFTGEPNTFIPSNFRVATSTNKIYYTLNNVTIGSNGKGSSPIESLNYGSQYNVDTNTITKIVNPLNGVTGVKNPVSITGGTDIETDAHLRSRYYNVLLGLGKSTILAIKNSILANTTATKVKLIENDTNEQDPETNLPPHSFQCYVFGGENNDILREIYKSRPVGITCVGDIETKFDGYISRFSRPTKVDLNFKVKLILSPTNTVPNIQDIVKKNIIEAIDDIAIGGKIDYTLFISSLYKNTNNSITSFENLEFYINISEKKGLGDFIQLKRNEIVGIVAKNITIEVDQK